MKAKKQLKRESPEKSMTFGIWKEWKNLEENSSTDEKRTRKDWRLGIKYIIQAFDWPFERVKKQQPSCKKSSREKLSHCLREDCPFSPKMPRLFKD
jgi:hypothetical protein